MKREPKPLYRKVNTKAIRVRHRFGGDFKDTRNKKRDSLEQVKGSMHGKKNRGLDYTPLFKFLLSKVGQNWDLVFKEASERLDRTDPIFWMVAKTEDDKKDYVRLGESTYYSCLFIDDIGILQKVNPNLNAKQMTPSCNCCTHTFNGEKFGREFSFKTQDWGGEII